MKRVRVAAIGAGYFSRFHIDAWSRMPGAELVAVCDRDGAKAEAAARAAGLAEGHTDVAAMLDKTAPDLVDIVTPSATHFDLIREIAGRRIGAICQKAFCRDLAEAERAAQIAEDAGIDLVVHENFRFQPWYRETARLIGSGALGDVHQIGFRLRPGDGQGPRAYLDRQPYFQSMERFLVHETAIHWIDTFRYLMGEVVAVTARLARLNPAIAGEDAGFILFDFASGARGLFDGNRLVDHAAADRRRTMGEMLVEGSAGVLRLDGDGALRLRRHGQNAEEPVAFEWQDRGFGGDCVYHLQRHVIDHLRLGTPLVNRARDYLANIRIEQAIYESHRSGRHVAL